MNAVAAFLRSQHQVMNYKARSCANSHRNDSCVATKNSHPRQVRSCIFPVSFQSLETISATFSVSSPTVQSHSPVPSPVHRI